MTVKNTFTSFVRGISRKKHVSLENKRSELKRCLTMLDLIALGVGSTLGAGVYVVVGEVAKSIAGPSVIISFLIAAIASMLSGLCYAEFGARVPLTGSAYVYSYVAVGELMAFIIGWNLILEYVIGTASVARAWSSNFDGFLDGWLSRLFKTHFPMHSNAMAEFFDPFSLVITLIVTAVLSFGVQESSMINNLFTAINLLVILFISIAGLFKADVGNWKISPANVNETIRNEVGSGGFFPFGIVGALSGAGTCFYSFVGFDIIATTGEEVRNPQRAIPISIITCLLICFVAYSFVSSILTLLVPYFEINEISPIPFAFAAHGWNFAKYVIAVGALCALTTSLLGCMFPLPRILYAMSNDGLIFKFFGSINERFKTPLLGTFLSGLLSGLMAALFSLQDLVDMMSIGTLLAYTLVSLSVLILRGRKQITGIQQLSKKDGDNFDLDEYGKQTDLMNAPSNGSSLNHNEAMLNNINNNIIHLEKKHEENERSDVDSSIKLRPQNLLRVCLRSKNKIQNPTNSTERMYTFCTYMLLISIFLLNVGLVQFGHSDMFNEKRPLFIFLVVYCCVLVIPIIFTCICMAKLPENRSFVSFKVPGVPWIPALSIFVNLYLMLKLSLATWVRFLVWMLIGFAIYFGYGYWHSTERNSKSEAENKIRNSESRNTDNNITIINNSNYPNM